MMFGLPTMSRDVPGTKMLMLGHPRMSMGHARISRDVLNVLGGIVRKVLGSPGHVCIGFPNRGRLLSPLRAESTPLCVAVDLCK